MWTGLEHKSDCRTSEDRCGRHREMRGEMQWSHGPRLHALPPAKSYSKLILYFIHTFVFKSATRWNRYRSYLFYICRIFSAFSSFQWFYLKCINCTELSKEQHLKSWNTISNYVRRRKIFQKEMEVEKWPETEINS